MESIDKKTDVKAHTVKEQYRHRLTKGYEYYRGEKGEKGEKVGKIVF